MGLHDEQAQTSPPASIDRDKARPADHVEYDDLHVPCPSHTTERRLVAKIDSHVMPYICILYLLAFLDRVNIANANVYGLSAELKLTGDKYNNCLVIFFVPYVLFEIPSNILLKHFRPRVWLSLCMFFFGLLSVCQGFVHSYSGLLAVRFFLGLVEASAFPGCFYLIGMWYQRKEAQKRFSFFFSSTTLAGAFGGLLAAAIGNLDGAHGYLAWRYIFWIEGSVTCAAGLAFFFVLSDFPEEAKWLTEEERSYVAARLRVDQGQSAIERQITAKDVGNVFKDFKVYLGGLMYFGLIVPAYGYAYFSPAIIKSYGYSAIGTQLHSVPPWAVAFVASMIIAWLSDRTQHRFAFTIIGTCIGLVGFAVLTAVHDNKHVQYGMLFLCTMGTYSVMPVIVCWFNLNLGGHHRRSVGSAWQIGFGNIGGIIAVYAFLSADAPDYITGFSICLAWTVLSMVSCVVYYIACRVQNRQRERAAADVTLTDHDKTEMGDLSPEYRYQL